MPDFPFAPEKTGNFCRKCCGIENVELIYSAGPSTGHCCHAAIFIAYVYIDPSQKSVLGTVNLNNDDDCQERYVTLTITSRQIEEMTRDLDDDNCCRVYAKLECGAAPDEDNGFGPGQCHTGIANLVATKRDSQNQTVTIFSGIAAESAVLIDACSVT
jgi:hypothetical protein